MGKFLHAAKVYKVEYAEPEFFNWNVEGINHLISSHTNAWFSDEYFEGSDEVEVNKDEFKELIAWLRNPDNKAKFEENEQELFDEGIAMDYIADCFERLLNSSDPNNDYVRLSWF